MPTRKVKGFDFETTLMEYDNNWTDPMAEAIKKAPTEPWEDYKKAAEMNREDEARIARGEELSPEEQKHRINIRYEVGKKIIELYDRDAGEQMQKDLEEKLDLSRPGTLFIVHKYGQTKAAFEWEMALPNARNLLAALGQGVDGVELPEDDMFRNLLLPAGMFRIARLRWSVSTDFLERTIYPGRVAFFGAGTAQEIGLLRQRRALFADYRLRHGGRFYLIDKDKDIVKGLKKKYGSEKFIRVIGKDLKRVLSSPTWLFKKLDGAVGNGLFDYIPPEGLEKVIPIIWNKLKDDGGEWLVFDIQFKHWELSNLRHVLGWNPLPHLWDPEEAFRFFERMEKILPDCHISYCMDPSEEPIGMVMALRKRYSR